MKSNYKYWLIAVFTILTSTSFAQEKVRGKVSGPEGDKIVPLPGVVLRWENSMDVALSDNRGNFELPAPDTFPKKLLISYTGFESDTLIVTSADKELKITL